MMVIWTHFIEEAKARNLEMKKLNIDISTITVNG